VNVTDRLQDLPVASVRVVALVVESGAVDDGRGREPTAVVDRVQ